MSGGENRAASNENSDRAEIVGFDDGDAHEQGVPGGEKDCCNADKDDYDYDDEFHGVVAYLPETLHSTGLLLSRLQAVMTRAWDPSEIYSGVAAAATSSSTSAPAFASGVMNPNPLAVVRHPATGSLSVGAAAVANAAGTMASSSSPSSFSVFGRPSHVGRGSGGGAVAGSEDDPLADTFMGSTRRARKWDWVRCHHSPVNPALAAAAAAAAARRAGGGDGGKAQPAMAPVAIDPAFCHRTLRPGKPGAEGCMLEQVGN